MQIYPSYGQADIDPGLRRTIDDLIKNMNGLLDTSNIQEVGGWAPSNDPQAGTAELLDASGLVALDSVAGAFSINSPTFGNSGIQLQYNAGSPRFYVGNGTTEFLKYDGTNLSWQGSNSSLSAAGAFVTTEASIGGWTVDATSIKDTAGVVGLSSTVTGGDDIRFWAGDATPGSAEFRVYESGALVASSATITGSITATSGRIANWYINTNTLSSGATEATSNVLIDSANSLLRLGPTSGNYLKLDGANIELESSNYVSGPLGAGFHIDTDLAEFGNIRARGKISTSVFEKDSISSVGGQLIVANADILASDMTALDASTLTITGDTTFAVNDILVSGDGTDLEYMRVTNIASAPTYTVTRDLGAAYSANANPVWKKGTAVSVLGSSDGSSAYSGGWLFMKGAGTNAPYYAVVRRTGLGATDFTENVRIGNLNGFLGYSSDIFGMGIGETGNNLTYDPTSGFSIKAGDGNVTLDDGGIQIAEITESEETYAQTRSLSWMNSYNERATYIGSVRYVEGSDYWRSSTYLVNKNTASESVDAGQIDVVVTNGGDVDAGASADSYLSLQVGIGDQPDFTLSAEAAPLTFTNTFGAVLSSSTGDNGSGTRGDLVLRATFRELISSDPYIETVDNYANIYLTANYIGNSIQLSTDTVKFTNADGYNNVIIKLYDSYGAGNNISFTVPTLSGNTAYTLPAADGSSGDVLKTDGSGNLGWLGAATDSARGTIELATNAETLTGTDTARAVTPDDIKYATGFQDGWIPFTPTCTYASWDDTYNTGTFTIAGDYTALFKEGLKIKFSQTTDGVKYAYVTKNSTYSAPNTTVTIFLGSDGAVGNLYDFDNETISNVYYSVAHAPVGFPVGKSPWTIRVQDTANRTQATPSASTWYNISQFDLSLPVGSWNVSYELLLGMNDTTYSGGGGAAVFSTLSTGNNTESDPYLTAEYLLVAGGDSASDIYLYGPVRRSKEITNTTAGARYLNIMINTANFSAIGIYSAGSYGFVQATLAYV